MFEFLKKSVNSNSDNLKKKIEPNSSGIINKRISSGSESKRRSRSINLTRIFSKDSQRGGTGSYYDNYGYDYDGNYDGINYVTDDDDDDDDSDDDNSNNSSNNSNVDNYFNKLNKNDNGYYEHDGGSHKGRRQSFNASLSRFTSINTDKFSPDLINLLHSKGLSNPFTISESKLYTVSLSSNGEHIFLPNTNSNEEDDTNYSIDQPLDNQLYDPVVYNFAIVLSLQREALINIKNCFINSILSVDWLHGIPNTRSITTENIELGHLNLGINGKSMNYYYGDNGHFEELNNKIISHYYKFNKAIDNIDVSYYERNKQFKDNLSLNGNIQLLRPGDHIFFNSILISPTISESISTLKSEVKHYFNLFINNEVHRQELKIIRGPPQLGSSTMDKALYINKVWDDSLSYEVILPKKFITLGEELPVKIKFSPLRKDLQLRRVKINLIEKVTYSSKDLKYEYDDLEPTINDTYIAGVKDLSNRDCKIIPLLDIKSSKKPSHALREETIISPISIQKDDNLLSCCYNENNGDINIIGPLKILSYLAFKNESVFASNKISKITNDGIEIKNKVKFNEFKHRIYPDSNNNRYVKISHKFQISLRISKKLNSNDEKFHHYEVLIDTPIYILHKNCTASNLILPSYDAAQFSTDLDQSYLPTFEEATSPINSPNLIPVDESTNNLLSRVSTIGSERRGSISQILESPSDSNIRYAKVTDVPNLPPPTYNESTPYLNSEDEESMDLTEQFHKAVYGN
ncbi:hypothetical protein WICMUC_004367 [Wickerhamomyces mucosus]|uniref:Arrestin C-terminal-like domain-containing protein n=1 Tax=Wickerhamomyces mucosus TaxID=1378264 RepID=A0A9P8PHN7_9ASCO|nr:hypothetical protein WICMUC_004367 [Wickerhamomyces mucosus]